MNSPSAGSRLAAYDIPLAIIVGVAALLISRLLKGYLPTPDGQLWLWICAGLGLSVAYGLSITRGFSGLAWVSRFSATYLFLQIVMQLLHNYGVI